jgi:hypothetical protein
MESSKIHCRHLKQFYKIQANGEFGNLRMPLEIQCEMLKGKKFESLGKINLASFYAFLSVSYTYLHHLLIFLEQICKFIHISFMKFEF